MLDRSCQPPRQRRQAARERRTRVQRNWRHRQAQGRIMVPVEVGAEILDLLVRLGWLDAALADDRAEIGKAIGAMIADAAR